MAARKKATKKKATRKKAAPKRRATKKANPKKNTRKKNTALDMIISKSRTKNAVSACNVSGEFYAALNEHVYDVIAKAEARAQSNGRKTVRPQDL